jgi:hypothetical protein
VARGFFSKLLDGNATTPAQNGSPISFDRRSMFR